MDVEKWEVGDIVEVLESCGGSTEGSYVVGDFDSDGSDLSKYKHQKREIPR